MSVSITGFVLEGPRVGSSNSTFTFSPDSVISSQSAFDTAYPSDESKPRTEYMVLALTDGKLPDVIFGWTSNQGLVSPNGIQLPFQRFDFDGRQGSFKTLSGASLEVVGTLATDANTNRLQVLVVPALDDLTNFPIRISVGTSSGTTFTVVLVDLDTDLNSPDPPVGTVQLSKESGKLGWNPADVTSFLGQQVRFQRQSFFTPEESNGQIGSVTAVAPDNTNTVLLLNPKLLSGQSPLLRFGFGTYLAPVERATEGAFLANPVAGTVEWAVTTGRLKFNSGDLITNAGRPVYYDGALFSNSTVVQTTAITGTVAAPGTLPVSFRREESDLFFRVVGVVQFPETLFVDTLSTPGETGVVQVRRSDGQVQFSTPDIALYGGSSAQAVLPDLPIEHGIDLRMFRSPVDLAGTDPDVKDVSAFYEATDAVLADPIIGAPQVFLPAVPVDTLPFDVSVQQGTGSFTGPLPRLDVAVPPAGLGYVINFDARELRYAQRNLLEVIDTPEDFGAVTLPNSLVFNSNLLVELENTPGGGIYTSLVQDESYLIDLNSGSVSLVQTAGTLELSGSFGSFAGTTFTDTTQNFTTSGILPGDLLVVLTGAAKGVYTITVVGVTTVTTDVVGVTSSSLIYEIRRGKEILADRFFREVPPVDPNTKVERAKPLGICTNFPRLSIPISDIPASRFRFGKTTFSTFVVVVANDGAFTAPGLIPQGTVQVSQTTGNLNFSSVDVTAASTVFWVKELTLGTDYRLQPELGFVEFTERMLELEEAVITYKDADGNLIQNERGTFIVRKEETQPHLTPTDTLTFNLLGREVAAVPTPRVFRGGRPQTATQVQVNVATSTIKFVGNPTVTDALPSGPTIQPIERVLIDYFIYEAIGGEKSLTILFPPMASVQISVTAGTNTLFLAGDRTAEFPANFMLRLQGDTTELYLIASSTYSGLTDQTTITITSPQTFLSDLRNPKIFVSSGPIRTTGTLTAPSYFIVEINPFVAAPRGSNKISVTGDVTSTYASGTILYFSGAGAFEFYSLSGASFDADTNTTVLSLTSNTLRQYNPGTHTLQRSLRSVLEDAATVVQTSRSPVLDVDGDGIQDITVFRRVEAQPGVLLVQPTDYKINDSGRVEFSPSLVLSEEISILYTGSIIVTAGRRVRASYTFGIVPNSDNGLLNQILQFDLYTAFIPDTFFWRVETLTNLRGEMLQEFTEAAQATIPSGGPMLENSSSPRLFEQGREGLFFQERRLANEDIVARNTLVFYNETVNYLEDALQDMDGRVVGDRDGRFLFDGLIDNPVRTSFATVTNQIDDQLNIVPSPFNITLTVYLPSSVSRFYPTKREAFGKVEVNPTTVETGDPIMDFGVPGLLNAESVRRRIAWAVLKVDASAGDFVVIVDDANGNTAQFRPDFAFGSGFPVIATVQDPTTVYESTIGITARTATTITFGLALTSDVPRGATVFVDSSDEDDGSDGFRKFYVLGKDLNVDLENGLLVDLDPGPPWTLPGIPASLAPTNPVLNELLDVTVFPIPTATDPERPPVFDGGITDDDGNRGLPILNPSTESESTRLVGTVRLGYLSREQDIIRTAGPVGTLRAATSTPFVGTGNLDVTKTIITLTAGVFPAPVPKIFDVVRILDGLNGLTSYHRVTVAGASSVTVTPAFAFVDAGFTFTVSTNTSLISQAATIGGAGLTVTGAGNFLTAGVMPGHTVVSTGAVATGQRRQIQTVTATVLTVSPAFTATGLTSIRVDDPLNTFGDAPTSIVDQDLVPVLNSEQILLDTNARPGVAPFNWSVAPPFSERKAIEGFFDLVFTDISTGTTGSTTIGLPTFTDASGTFQTDGVLPGHYVYIRSGASQGIYKVTSVASETSLDVETNFPATAGSITYRIVKVFGASQKALENLFAVLVKVDTAITNVTDFETLLTTAVPVLPDAGAFATGTLETDLDTREAQVSARVTDLDVATAGGSTLTIQSILSSVDKIYNARFIWIDSRINRETGFLEKKSRAISNREAATEEILKQLTKILAMEE